MPVRIVIIGCGMQDRGLTGACSCGHHPDFTWTVCPSPGPLCPLVHCLEDRALIQRSAVASKPHGITQGLRGPSHARSRNDLRGRPYWWAQPHSRKAPPRRCSRPRRIQGRRPQETPTGRRLPSSPGLAEALARRCRPRTALRPSRQAQDLLRERATAAAARTAPILV